MHSRIFLPLFLLASLAGFAQDPAQLLEALAGRQNGASLTPAAPAGLSLPPLSLPDLAGSGLPGPEGRLDNPGPASLRGAQDRLDRLDREIRKAKAAEQGPKRFASDLFEFRQLDAGVTEGGIADDYVLGVGDRLQLNLYGSVTQEAQVAVDGRGCLAIPKVGTVQVAGLSLARARAAVEARIRQVFSRASVDLSVRKLREVRVFVLGEVYRPGSFLVPSLTSVINVLSLSGGPTPAGSFRRIQLVRGGSTVRTLDLYPLRARGEGSFNLGFQNGDTVFVPLMANPVRLEGAFTRVVATVPEERRAPEAGDTGDQKLLKRRIRSLELSLGQPSSLAEATDLGLVPSPSAALVPGPAAAAPPGAPSRPPAGPAQAAAFGLLGASATALPGAPEGGLNPKGPGPAAPQALDAATLPPASQRALLQETLEYLKEQLRLSKARARGDKRVQEDDEPDETAAQPLWVSRWLAEGTLPAMQFELLPGETVQDAIAFAGGFALQAFAGSVSLQRLAPSGALQVTQVPAGPALAGTVLERGDVLTAMPLREGRQSQVTVSGWARVQGVFARPEGLRVGALLRGSALVLPDTYLGRGEVVRTTDQGARQYFAFDLAKAMAGEAAHDLLLEDGDEVDLYRLGDLRLPRTLSVVGPVKRPGTYEFLEGMRASDLLFRAGLPLLKADRFVAELGRFQDGRYGAVRPLDLARLLSTEEGSPVDLKDEQVNPVLHPFDQISIYARPDFRTHRVVTLSGQVARPGVYELDAPGVTLRTLIQRAGGLTAEAMPSAGIFLRSLVQADPDRTAATSRAGIGTQDPTANGINEILQRLNETKRLAVTGALLDNPLLHGLATGSLNRLVVDFPGLLAGDPAAEVELQDGDEVIFPRRTDVAYVVGETASPFGAYKVSRGLTVRDILAYAGGPTRNADTGGIRLLKADGRIVDRGVKGRTVEPGDALLVPQRIRRDSAWQENMAALTPLAVLINAVRR